MNILQLFDTCGYIFGPSIMAAGAAALVLCAWATFRSTSQRTLRRAVWLAALPFALGLCGFLVGLAVCWNARLPVVPWLALGKVCFAGTVVSIMPLAWALLLVRKYGRSEPRIPAES